MIVRLAGVWCAVALIAPEASGFDRPGIISRQDSSTSRWHAWQVRYSPADKDADPFYDRFPSTKRLYDALRIEVRYLGGSTEAEYKNKDNYRIFVRRYELSPAGGYVLRRHIGDGEELKLQHLDFERSNRKFGRIALRSERIDYDAGGVPYYYQIVAVWHPGESDQRYDDYLHVLLYDSEYAPRQLDGNHKNGNHKNGDRDGDCPEEPDTDVLEEEEGDPEPPEDPNP